MLYRKVLVPMALDHGVSEHTLEVARTLCADGGDIIGLHVYEPPSNAALAFMEDNAVQRGIDRARASLTQKTKDMPDIKSELVTGHTYRSIIDYAKKNEIDCIVMGSHRPGLSDYLLGSTAARVVRHAPCAVHVYRGN